MSEYEALDYDAPNQLSSSSMFTIDSDYMSPPLFSQQQQINSFPFDHSSPSSNASGPEKK